MGGQGGHRRVTGLTGQERSAVFSHGRGSSERERLRHSHQPSFHRTFPRENRLQARAPESPGGGAPRGSRATLHRSGGARPASPHQEPHRRRVSPELSPAGEGTRSM